MPVHVCFCLSLSVSCTFFLPFICLESNISSLLSPFCSSSESWSIHFQLTTYLLCTPYILSKNTKLTYSSALSGHPSSRLHFLCEIELSLQCRAHFLDPIFKKWSEPTSFLWFLCETELSLQVSCAFCRPHLQKVVRTPVFLRFLCGSSRYSLVHILSTSSQKVVRTHFFYEFYVKSSSRCLIFRKWFELISFLRFFCEIQLSLQSRAHFLDPIFKKWSVSFYDFCVKSSSRYGLVRTHKFFYSFYVKSSSCYSIVQILFTTFCDRGAQPRKQRPSSGDHGRPLYKRKHGYLRARVFSSVNSRVPDRSHFSTTWWWCGWHDDVVDMMVRQLAIDDRPQLGSFLTKLPLKKKRKKTAGFGALLALHSLQFINVKSLISIHSFQVTHSFQFIHFNSFISSYSCQFSLVNLFMSSHSCQFTHVKSFISIHLCQFIHVNSFMSILSWHFIHVNSFASIPSFQFIHFNSFMSFMHFKSFMSMHLFFHASSFISVLSFNSVLSIP